MLRSSTACAAAVALALALVGLPRGSAAPITVSIRARAELTLHSVRRVDDGRVVVRGVLRDRVTGAGFPDQSVRVSAGAASATVLTGGDGIFSTFLDAPPGPVDVRLEFAGAGGIDAASVVSDDIDPSKAPVDLTMTAQATPLGALVTVTATADGLPLELPVTVRVTPADADEPHKDSRLVTGKPTAIKRADALGTGSRRFTARFDGDAGHGPATTSAIVVLGSDTRTELGFADASVPFDATVRARGRVTDPDGAPIAKVTVTLVTGDKRRLGSAVTGADGKYAIDVEADLLGAGRHALVASAETREAWLRPSQSPPAFLEVGAPRPAPVAITIAAFAATALTALGFIYARRRREQKVVAASERTEARVADEPRGGLEHGKASLVSTLRRASDHGFAGLVRDSVRGRPVAGATVLLALGAEARRTESADDGRFALEALTPGEWTARVAAPGHLAEKFTVSIPHRGELRGVRVDLVPVRERVFSIYRGAALPLLPRAELWGIWSPRQIVDHVRAHRPPPALSALTALVEEVYFSARISDEDLIPTAEARAAAAIAERAGGVPVDGPQRR